MPKTIIEDAEPRPFRLADSISHLLHRAEQLAAERFAQLVGEAVTLRQFAVLAVIAEAPGLSQSQLVVQTGIDRSTLADMVVRMEKRGWIDRPASALDARARAVRLQPAGEAVLAASTLQARAADAAILDALTRAKSKAFVGTLSKLAKAADDAAAKRERQARRQTKREAQARRKPKQSAHRKSRAQG